MRCAKCAGTGCYIYTDRSEGVCYQCDGTGVSAYRAPRKANFPRRVHPPEELRIWYVNARKGLLTLDSVLDAQDGWGWTLDGLRDVLSTAPGALEAFRGLGWEV